MFAMTRKKTVAGVLIAAAAVTAAVVLARSGDHHKAPAPPTAEQRVLEFGPQDVARASVETMARTIPITGTLVPLQQAVVKTRAPGVLTAVLAREGESVRKGQLLARVDETEVRAQLAARQADVAAAQAQLGWAQRNLGRQRELLDKGFISRNAFDTVQNEEQVARARLDAARAQQAQAAKALADAQLPSPIDGIVATRHAEPGERLPADAPVLTVVSLERLELAVDVPTSEIAGVSVGQPVRVRVDGFADRVFEGRVERINPQATAGAGVVPVYLVVDNADRALRAGLFAHGELMLSAGQPRVVVPAGALHGEGAERYLFAVEGGRVTKRPVSVEYAAGGRAVIATGLAEGTTVVAVNLGQLPVGAQALVAGSNAEPGSGDASRLVRGGGR
jgi:RND family efflux transporter MFP subunit